MFQAPVVLIVFSKLIQLFHNYNFLPNIFTWVILNCASWCVWSFCYTLLTLYRALIILSRYFCLKRLLSDHNLMESYKHFCLSLRIYVICEKKANRQKKPGDSPIKSKLHIFRLQPREVQYAIRFFWENISNNGDWCLLSRGHLPKIYSLVLSHATTPSYWFIQPYIQQRGFIQ